MCEAGTKRTGASNMNIHYDVTGLLMQCGGHPQVRLFGLHELAREDGGSELKAHRRDIQKSTGSRQLDR